LNFNHLLGVRLPFAKSPEEQPTATEEPAPDEENPTFEEHFQQPAEEQPPQPPPVQVFGQNILKFEIKFQVLPMLSADGHQKFGASVAAHTLMASAHRRKSSSDEDQWKEEEDAPKTHTPASAPTAVQHQQHPQYVQPVEQVIIEYLCST